MKSMLFGGLAAAALLAGCNKPAEAPAPEAAAPEATEATAAAPAPEARKPAVVVNPADLPADQTTAAQKAELEKAAADAGIPATKQSRANYVCDNGETIEVRFFPDQGIAVLVRGGQNAELHPEPADSGFRYSNGQTTIAGKGNELQLNVGMMATAQCKVKAG